MRCFYTQTELNEALVIDWAKVLLSHSDRYSAEFITFLSNLSDFIKMNVLFYYHFQNNSE